MAIYHFARTADDLADEGPASAAQRLQDLDDFRLDLAASLEGQPRGPRWPQVFDPLARSIETFALPAAPLRALLDAFEQDVHNPPYADRAALLAYCQRSASPVGRLLMHLYGIAEAASLRQADAICSALQLINFWQDLSIDGPRGRLYIPMQDLDRWGVSADSVRRCQDGPAQRALVAELCSWARSLMLEGAPLALRVPGRAGWELRLVVQGGLRILEKIERMKHAALSTRPRLTVLDVPLLLARALTMSANTRPTRP